MSETVEMTIAAIVLGLLVFMGLPFFLWGIKEVFIDNMKILIEFFCKCWLEAWHNAFPKKETKEDAAGLPESAKQELLDSFMKGADK